MQRHLISVAGRGYACGIHFTRSGGDGTRHPAEVTCARCQTVLAKDSAYRQGHDAGREGDTKGTCPHAAGILRQSWLEGWREGVQFRACPCGSTYFADDGSEQCSDCGFLFEPDSA